MLDLIVIYVRVGFHPLGLNICLEKSDTAAPRLPKEYIADFKAAV